MHPIPTTLVVATVAGSLALLCGFRGQGEQDPTKSPSAAIARQRIDTVADDATLAYWLVVDNKNVITLSRMAQQRAQDPEVKRFAATMLTTHEALLEKLRPFAKDNDLGTDGSTVGRGTDGRGTDGRGTDGRGTDGRGTDGRGTDGRGTDGRGTDGRDTGNTGRDTARAFPAGMSNEYPHSALLKELADQCLASAQAELQQKNGPQFDRCFMGMAIGGHMHAIDKLTVFQRHVSGDLKNVMAEAQRETQTHFEEAKLIAQKLESKDPRIATPNRDAK